MQNPHCLRCRDHGIYFADSERHFCDCPAAQEYLDAVTEARVDLSAARAAINEPGELIPLDVFKTKLLH